MKNCAIVLGAGSGSRMKAGMNKVFLPLNGIPVIVYSVAAYTGYCEEIVVTASKNEVEKMKQILAQYGLSAKTRVVAGGTSRQESVWAALSALPEDTDIVLIHDGARPLVTDEVISASMRSAEERGSGVAAVPVVDTIKRANAEGAIVEDLQRAELFAMQTPQSFSYALIRRAHLQAQRDGLIGTDDAALVQHLRQPVYLSEGNRENLKLTTPMDMLLAEQIIAMRNQG